MKILIAEDDLTSRNILTTVLEKKGHEVIATVDGQEAWEKIQQPDAPRLAILDWMMPELDGIEVSSRIREIDSDRPTYIIMLTALNEKDHIITGLDAGADDYLAKPYDPQELYARVRVGQRIIKIQNTLAEKVQELEEALSTIKTLSGLVPICSHCKNIRNDDGYWEQVDVYMRNHSDAEFSHGICPGCMEKYYSDIMKASPADGDSSKT